MAPDRGAGDGRHPGRPDYRAGRYWAWDPVCGSERTAGAAEAETFAPRAWMLYRNYPTTAVSLHGLVRFAGHGLGTGRLRFG